MKETLTEKACVFEGVNWASEEIRTSEGQNAILNMLNTHYGHPLTPEERSLIFATITETASYIESMKECLEKVWEEK